MPSCWTKLRVGDPVVFVSPVIKIVATPTRLDYNHPIKPEDIILLTFGRTLNDRNDPSCMSLPMK